MARKKSKKIDEDLPNTLDWVEIRDTSESDTKDYQGSIKLKDGNRKGLTGLVKIIENVDIELNYSGDIKSIEGSGIINIENPSSNDRLWDIDVSLENIKRTDLQSDIIQVRELGTEPTTNSHSEEYEIVVDIQSPILVRELINTTSKANKFLNFKNIQNFLQNGISDNLEYLEIDPGKKNKVTFAIAIRNLFGKPLSYVEVLKKISNDFSNPIIIEKSDGHVEIEDNNIIWNIKKFPKNKFMLLKFTCDYIGPGPFLSRGDVEVKFVSSQSTLSGVAIDKYDSYTRNKFYVHTVERDDNPGVWDCRLIFENSSDFIIQLFNADVYLFDDESIKYVDIDPSDVPLLPAGAQWHSQSWKIESEEYPAFRKKLEFRVMPDFQVVANGKIRILDDRKHIVSVLGDVLFDNSEIPTYKKTDVNASLKIINNSTVPLNEIVVEHFNFTEEFHAPNPEEFTLFMNDIQFELQRKDIILDEKSFKIIFKDLRSSQIGLFLPETVLKIKYPIHCINPSQNAVFKPDVKILAKTYPKGKLTEYIPLVQTLKTLHIRRRFRIRKRIVGFGDFGQYQIKLHLENLGNNTLYNMVIRDKVPDSFEYSDFSLPPEITDEVGSDILKWIIEKVYDNQSIEISYQINGAGDYNPSDAQIAY